MSAVRSSDLSDHDDNLAKSAKSDSAGSQVSGRATILGSPRGAEIPSEYDAAFEPQEVRSSGGY